MLDRDFVRDVNRLIRQRRAAGELPEIPSKPPISAARGTAKAQPQPEAQGGGAGLVSPLTRISITEVTQTIVSDNGTCEIDVEWAQQRTYRDAAGTEIVFIDPVIEP